jgi:eukaryotic-like serine/threonine-protein kinase
MNTSARAEDLSVEALVSQVADEFVQRLGRGERPNATLRDPARAVELAGQAVAQEPEVGKYWNTLGVAHYRAGQWAAAIGDLELSMARGGGGPYDWFFLAMASWCLGDRVGARAWHAKSIAWMDQKAAQEENLLRYRAEAALLLGTSKTERK